MSKPAHPSRLQSVISTILVCLFAAVAMLALEVHVERSMIAGFRLQNAAMQITESVLHETTTEMGCQSTGLVYSIDGHQLAIFRDGVFGPFERLLLLTAIVMAVTVALCRTWGFGPIQSTIVVILSALLTLPLILVLPALFVGIALGTSDSATSAGAKIWVARDVGLLLSCAIIALICWLVSWIGDEEQSPPATPPVPRVAFTTSMAVAIATASLLAALRFAAAAGVKIATTAGAPAVGGDPWLAARWAIGAGLLLTCAALIFISIFRTNMVRWAWLAALAVVPLGGGIASAVPLLAAVIAARDQRFRSLRGLPLGPSAPQKIARRSQRPLIPAIWIITAIVACGAWARYYEGAGPLDGLGTLARPALFFPLLIIAALLVFWQWNHLRRLAGLRFTSPALAALLIAASGTLYGVAHHRDVVIDREIAGAEPYFQRVKAAVAQVPSVVGPWHASNLDIKPSDPSLAHTPNAILSRYYRDSSRSLEASLLIVDWRDPRDLLQYYSPFNASRNGFEIVATEDADWTVGTRHITGTQFTFERSVASQKSRLYVAYFIVSPNGQFLRKLPQVSSEMREMRTNGAAEFQIVIDREYPPETIRQITTELLTAALPAIDAITQP